MTKFQSHYLLLTEKYAKDKYGGCISPYCIRGSYSNCSYCSIIASSRVIARKPVNKRDIVDIKTYFKR